MKSTLILVCGLLILSGCSTTKKVQTAAITPTQALARAPSQEAVGQWLKEYWLEISGQTYLKEMKSNKAQCIDALNNIKKEIRLSLVRSFK